MLTKQVEKGQALVLITLAAVALFAFAALAIDGTRAYSDKRHAQNAADTAALAGALAYTRAGVDVDTEAEFDLVVQNAAQPRATSNGYDGGTSSDVTISSDPIATGCPGGSGRDVTVKIVSYLDTTLARVLGRYQVTNAVTATARACNSYQAPLLTGDAIIALNDNETDDCGIDTKNGEWYITGSGIFSNGCAKSHNKTVALDGKCVTSVTSATGATFDALCTNENQSTKKIVYPGAVDAIMPANPCTGAITGGRFAGGGKVATSGQTTFDNDVYCISNLDALDKKDIILNNATLFVTDLSFELKFTGHGGMSGTATEGGTYAGSEEYDGYFMIVARNNAPCTDYVHGEQVIVIRGNSGQDITGTLLAPSACLDLSGTSDGHAMHSQIIGYTVSSNGNAELHINYNAADNHQEPVEPTISQWK